MYEKELNRSLTLNQKNRAKYLDKYHGFLHSIPTESTKRFKLSTSSNMRSSESPHKHLLIFVKPADNNSSCNAHIMQSNTMGQ